MADAKDYLELWRERYSFPNYITGHDYLTENGNAVPGTNAGWSAAQKLLLNGNAIGTPDGYYLNPIPLFNRLDHIYSDIVKKGFMSARSDSIKMNVKNMDYTNGSSDTVKTAPRYPFFNFYGYDLDDIENEIFYSGQEGINGIYLAQFFPLIRDYEDGRVNGRVTYTIPKSYAEKTKTQTNKTILSEIERFNGIYELWNESEELELLAERFKKDKNDLWIRFNIVDEVADSTVTYYGPSNEMLILYVLYCNYLAETFFGLQLLMPQYKRRVEVEDLNKNFWVISTILDAVVNTLWGPYGLIDVVRQLIAKVTQIEDFLGLNSLTGIELLYNGDNELYFDMYSRFLLSGLELKLKTQSGERVIKNIFKSHSELSDRKSTTDVYESREELFEATQFAEITSVESGYQFTGLYDSDLICSDDKIKISEKPTYISLSTVIDAINNTIVSDNGVGFGSINYDIGPAYREFFGNLDITPDGTLSPTDYEMIATDNRSVSNGATLTPEQIERFKKYTLAKEYLEDLVNRIDITEGDKKLSSDKKELLNNLKIESLEDIDKYFTSKKVLVDTSIDTIDTDENGAIDTKEFLNYANDQIKQIKDFFNNLIQTFGASDDTINNIEDIGNDGIKISTAMKGDDGSIGHFAKVDVDNKGLKSTLTTLQELSEYLNRYYIVNKTNKEYLDVLVEDIFENTTNADGTTTKTCVDALVTIKKTGNPDNIPGGHYVIAINEFDDVGVLPTEDIYTYSLYGLAILAKKFLPKKGDFDIWFDTNTTVGEKFFDVSDANNDSPASPGKVNLSDAFEIAKSLLPKYNNGEYFAKIKTLMTLIDNDDASDKDSACVGALAELANINKNHKNPFPTGVVNESVKTAIKNYFFVKKYDGNPNSVKIISEVCCPNLYMLIEIAKMAQPIRDRKGYEINAGDKQAIINTITKTNYQLHDNILIFLYDKDYYKIQYDEEETTTNSGEAGLYVDVTDGFYKTNQPVIKYHLKRRETTHFLFIPRTDLIGGEIIELRLTEKGVNKEILDLSQLTDKGFTQMKTTNSRLFLSLHNSFADIPAQYNHRTTLFFKDTVPEDISTLGHTDNPFKDINSWFCNGIECQYFKPTMKKVNEDTILSSQQTKLVDLTIKASMICKAENINDNSFIFEEGPTESKLNNETFYSFARKMAFGAAQRHNLVFYSSSATHDGDMFVHSPSQLLLSPSLRGDESIQPPYWVSDSEYAKRIYPYDVMNNAGDTCKLADITSMLYKNSLTKEKTPLVIDAIWGMRDVDNYIKPKKIKYIIIEREPGSRNNTYGPTSIGFSHSSGYLHSGNGLTSLGEYSHYTEYLQIQWYTSKGMPVNNSGHNFPPANAKYGVINLERLAKEKGTSALQFAQTFMIRFYSSDITKQKTQDEFITKIGGQTVYRRPIFKMAYFLGEDMTEKEFLNNKNYSKGDK